jgi:hypothetical protein
MKTIVLAALFGLGVALALPAPASAAAIGSGISDAAKASSLLEDVRCRSRRVCYRNHWGRVRCTWRRYCW